MPSFSDVEQAAPGLAAEVLRRLDAHVHKTLATLRADGSPRIAGTETRLVDGELHLGAMWQSRKARDLQRDARFALHSGSDDPQAWTGDAKLAGVVAEVAEAAEAALVTAVLGADARPGPSYLVRLDLREVSVVHLVDDGAAIAIDVWTPAGGLRTIRPE